MLLKPESAEKGENAREKYQEYRQNYNCEAAICSAAQTKKTKFYLVNITHLNLRTARIAVLTNFRVRRMI